MSSFPAVIKDMLTESNRECNILEFFYLISSRYRQLKYSFSAVKQPLVDACALIESLKAAFGIASISIDLPATAAAGISALVINETYDIMQGIT